MVELATGFLTGRTNFKEIREDNGLYIDKTAYIHRMIQNRVSSIYWFLARPRRFGKSLFVDTLNNLFLGRKELFEGLAIHSQGYDFAPYPVINLSMDSVSSHSAAEMNSSLINKLEAIARVEDIPVSNPNRSNKLPPLRPIDIFSNLILGMKVNYKKNVVVLIDEYDKPILDNLDNEVVVEDIRKSLKEFYVTLKSLEKDLHFVFITGISKVAQTAVHSVLNNLTDLTLDDDYAAICGYSIEEFHAAFDPYLEVTLERMRAKGRVLANHTPEGLTKAIFQKYDGYSWDGRTRILNPFSINSFFSAQKFEKFWFVTGPPTYLDQAIKMDPYAFAKLSLTEYGKSKLLTASLGSANPVPTLFQTGYLTVDKVIYYDPTSDFSSVSDYDIPPFLEDDEDDEDKDETFYTLKVPNEEVKSAYNKALFTVLYPTLTLLGDVDKKSKRILIKKSLIDKNTVILENEFRAILSALQNHLHLSDHRYYQSVLYYALFGLNLTVHSEVMSAEGRSDLEITLSRAIKVIIELKYISAPNVDNKDDSNQVESIKTEPVKADVDWINKKLDQAVQAALAQIEEKKYALQYLGRYKVLKMGLAIYHRAEVKVGFGPDQERNF